MLRSTFTFSSRMSSASRLTYGKGIQGLSAALHKGCILLVNKTEEQSIQVTGGGAAQARHWRQGCL